MTSPAFDPATMNRLVFIGLLYQQGIEQSRQPWPLSAASILTFHDTAELFLILAAEHRQAGPVARDSGILQYWTLLRPRRGFAGVELSGQHGIGRLTSVRNDFKHLGAIPSADAIIDARSAITGFLEDNTPKVFGLEFSGIDMAEVIPQAEARDKVKAATAAEASGGRAEAMALLSEAYEDLFPGTGTGPDQSPTAFGETIRTYLSTSAIESVLRQAPDPRVRRTAGITPYHLASHIAQLTEAARQMQWGLRVIALGIDYRQFTRFLQLTPRIVHYADHSERDFPPGYAPSNAEFDYCRQFIITAALRVAELEAYTTRPSWKTA